FNFLRHTKPSKVIEIGCGSSTKIITHAQALNQTGSNRQSRHICIEPYKQSWLDEFKGIELLREPVERIDGDLFSGLKANDLLFIDSSHIIRPQGDVLREYLDIIPRLASGVFVHVHDIFSPSDYPDEWIKRDVKFWNEQYMLEAMLSNNPSYRVIAALNFLKHDSYDALKTVCTHLTKGREPGSFYFVTA
ncbi:MAG: class I SAM-dependent methyltransferase, partial [Pseudomonadota bacterium]